MPPAVETPRRRASTKAAIARSVLLLCILVTIALLSACDNDGSGSLGVVLTGSDGARLTRLTFETEDGSEAFLFVEVADSPEERGRGLMFRESLPEGQGMLFVFEQDGQPPFYMRNTLVPLSIAFVKSDGTIVEIEDMDPETEDLHIGSEPYRYTVEANQGWYERHGVSAGSLVMIPALTAEVTATANPSP